MKIFFKDLTIVQLKEQLDNFGLSTKGMKADLSMRLQDQLRKENRDPGSVYIEVEPGPPIENEEVGVKEMFASVVSMVQNLSIQISSVQQGLTRPLLG
jgi:hypothetical protein